MDFEQQPMPKPESEQLKGMVVCAWCKKEIGRWEGPGISHGICSDCKKTYIDPEMELLNSKEKKN
ncbi:MAG: hypothetical protein NTZ18_04010 [Candidatus Komeilibacteria bacterium]|nr:hypothetical protein [Candidatus Komeilibacteria bacterium]